MNPSQVPIIVLAPVFLLKAPFAVCSKHYANAHQNLTMNKF